MAIYGVDSKEYSEFKKSPGIEHKKAMRSTKKINISQPVHGSQFIGILLIWLGVNVTPKSFPPVIYSEYSIVGSYSCLCLYRFFSVLNL